MNPRRLTRRKFLLVAAPSVSAMLAACTTPAAPTQAPANTAVPPTDASGATAVAPTEAPTAAAATEAAPAGKVMTTSFYPDSSPNPWISSDVTNWRNLLYEPLVAMDSNYDQIIPALAESWEVSDDGLEYTFHLRPDVLWHDGEPFTSADVIWSFTTILNKATASTLLPTNLMNIKGATAFNAGEADAVEGLAAPDDLTVVITAEQNSSLFLRQLSTVWILPQHLLGDVPPEQINDHEYFKSSFVSLGAFKFREWEPGQFITLDANPDFYRGAPQIASIVSRNIQDSSVLIASMENGEVDAGLLLTPDDIDRMSANPNFDTWPSLPVGGNLFEAGIVPPQLGDKRARQAILHAIDRQTIVETLLKNSVQVIDAPFVAAWLDTGAQNPYPYDPDRARALLEEVGWDFNVPVEISTYYTGPFEGQLLAVFAQYLNDVGIQTTIRQAEWANLEADWTSGNFGIMYEGSGIGPEPDSTAIYFESTSGFNTRYIDPQVDELYQAGRVELDPDRRAEIYSELAAVLNDQAWYMMLWTAPRFFATRKTIQNIQGNLISHYNGFYNESEQWTIADA